MIRKDIQVYRCLAVVSVIIYHFNSEILPFGYLGVDLFFVISGYLITQQILNLKIENKFKLSDFYFRRFKRIFPSLISSSIFTLIIGFYNLSLEHFYELLRGIKYSLLFIGNIFFSQTSSYFTLDSKRNLIINLWSLSVEEQFYIVFPFLILAGTKFKKIKFSSFVLICLIMSIVGLSEYFFTKLSLSKIFFSFDNYLFYSPFSRVFQFLSGSFGATFNFKIFKKLNKINIFFLFLLLLSFYFSINSLNQIVVTVLAFFLVSNQIYIKDSLLAKLLIHIGNISYSLYLFHQPILAGLRNHIYYSHFDETSFNYLDKILFVIILLLMIYLISIFNFYTIEQTYRKKNKYVFKHFKLVVIGFFVILGLVQFPSFLGNLNNRSSNYIEPTKSISSIWKTKSGTNYLIKLNNQLCIDQDLIESACRYGKGEKKLIILGDSVISSMVSGLLTDDLLEKYTIVEFTKSGCYPVINICSFNLGNKFYNEVFSIYDSTFIIGGIYGNIPEEYLELTINRILHNNNKVILLGYLPAPKVDEVMYFKKTSKFIKSYDQKHYYDELNKSENFNVLVKNLNISDKSNFTYIDLFKTFCKKNECIYFSDLGNFFIDGIHLSYFGSKTLIEDSQLKNYLLNSD